MIIKKNVYKIKYLVSVTFGFYNFKNWLSIKHARAKKNEAGARSSPQPFIYMKRHSPNKIHPLKYHSIPGHVVALCFTSMLLLWGEHWPPNFEVQFLFRVRTVVWLFGPSSTHTLFQGPHSAQSPRA